MAKVDVMTQEIDSLQESLKDAIWDGMYCRANFNISPQDYHLDLNIYDKKTKTLITLIPSDFKAFYEFLKRHVEGCEPEPDLGLLI